MLPLLLLLLFSAVPCAQENDTATAAYCTYTQYGWAARVCELALPGGELCGELWCDLMQSNVPGLFVPANAAWLLAAHQYIAATLNRWQLLTATPPNGSAPLDFTALDAALLTQADALERACGNVSFFGGGLPDAAALLFRFNHGGLPGTPAPCADEFLLADGSGMRGNEFYYYNAPDIIALRSAAGNATEVTSVLRGLYNQGTFFMVVALLEAVCLVLLGAKLLMMRNAQRDYMWNLAKSGGGGGGGGGVGTINEGGYEMRTIPVLIPTSEDESEAVPSSGSGGPSPQHQKKKRT